MEELENKLNLLSELISSADLNVKTHKAFADVLSSISKEMYGIREDNKRLLANYRALNESFNSLNTRYSEVLYKLAEIRSGER